jgi:glycosyltransferase involved in cell wall biosynthesis
MNMNDPLPSRRAVYILCPGGLEYAGGIGRAMSYLIKQWSCDKTSIPAKVIDTRGGGHLAFAPLFLLLAMFRISILAATGRIALLHINVASRGSAVRKCIIALLCVLLRTKFVMHLHGAKFDHFYAALPRPAQWVVRWMFRHADRVIVLGIVWQRFVIDTIGLAPDRVEIICNGVPASSETPARRTGHVHIVFLGRLGDRKGVPELLKALSADRLTDLDWKATLAGDGDIARFKADAAKCGLAARVTFPGWLGRDDTATLLASADIFVLPSHHEGLPVAVLEALACGLATIATPVGSLPEFLVDQVSVIFVQPGDVAQLTDALELLVKSPDHRRGLSQQARKVFHDHFDIETTARAFQMTYQSICHGQSPIRQAEKRPAPVPSVGR